MPGDFRPGGARLRAEWSPIPIRRFGGFAELPRRLVLALLLLLACRLVMVWQQQALTTWPSFTEGAGRLPPSAISRISRTIRFSTSSPIQTSSMTNVPSPLRREGALRPAGCL